MRQTLRRLGPVALLAAAAVVVPATGAAARPAQRPLPTAPVVPGHPLALSLADIGLPVWTPVATGPVVVGSTFNGGTSVVVSNAPPIGSGNVVDAP